jgi:kinesin family protein 11
VRKHQVAVTRYNNLSSCSHTIFTITVLTKQTNKPGKSYINTDELNLVDLAGSENIQQSGAEDKRAAEAGLINKSILTLGRVINALVEKTSIFPIDTWKIVTHVIPVC